MATKAKAKERSALNHKGTFHQMVYWQAHPRALGFHLYHKGELLDWTAIQPQIYIWYEEWLKKTAALDQIDLGNTADVLAFALHWQDWESDEARPVILTLVAALGITYLDHKECNIAVQLVTQAPADVIDIFVMLLDASADFDSAKYPALQT